MSTRGGDYIGQVTQLPGWKKWVNTAGTDEEVEAIRQSVNRGMPFGRMAWSGEPQNGWDSRPA
ncbi:MAG: hypothetical protein NPIRA04_23650 [Nitrospirales bacterium]|nr:MAG: hypothetical protein NPIRA04_23650 [Nitrospirales bacterium]